MAKNPTPAPPAAPKPAATVHTSKDPFVKLAHLVERLAAHVHHHVKNKDAALAVETAKTHAEAQELLQHPIVQMITDKENAGPTDTLAEPPAAPPAPDTPAK